MLNEGWVLRIVIQCYVSLKMEVLTERDILNGY